MIPTSKKVAFVYPGQGSQCIDIFHRLIPKNPIIQSVFEEASEALGYDMWQLVQERSIKILNQTIYTQPFVLATSIALWKLWGRYGGMIPHFLAGHSLGEYTAYVCAKTLTFEQALQIVAKRGAYMQEAVKNVKGGMAVIAGLTKEEVATLCQEAKNYGLVWPGNYNAINQVVISGESRAVDRVLWYAKEKGAYLVRKLPVSVPAHCPLMQSATMPFFNLLDQTRFQSPSIPVVSNAHLQPLDEISLIKQSLVDQLVKPVNWVGIIDYLVQQGVNCFIECGPNQVLSGLIRKHLKNKVQIIALNSLVHFEQALDRLSQLG